MFSIHAWGSLLAIAVWTRAHTHTHSSERARTHTLKTANELLRQCPKSLFVTTWITGESKIFCFISRKFHKVSTLVLNYNFKRSLLSYMSLAAHLMNCMHGCSLQAVRKQEVAYLCIVKITVIFWTALIWTKCYLFVCFQFKLELIIIHCLLIVFSCIFSANGKYVYKDSYINMNPLMNLCVMQTSEWSWMLVLYDERQAPRVRDWSLSPLSQAGNQYLL